MTSYYTDLLRAVAREFIRLKSWAVALFLLLSFGILAVGLFWPKSYQTSAMLYADVTNIIQPLLQGRAEITVIDRSQQARDRKSTRLNSSHVATSYAVFRFNTKNQ